MEINRNNLLLEVEKVADDERRETLKQAINSGGAIHLKFQKEQASLRQKNNDYEALIKKLQYQIEQIKPAESEKDRRISHLQEDLIQAKKKMNELETELSTSASKHQPHEPSDIELKKWNWGAFVLSWVWGLHNRLYWQSLVVLAFWIIQFLQYTATLMFEYYRTKWVLNNSFLKSLNELNPWIFPIIIFIASLILGFFGTRWAWKAKKWDNWELFLIAQRRWNKAVLWAIPIVLLFSIAIYLWT